MTDAEKAILLGGYAAKRCPVRTHNEIDPGLRKGQAIAKTLAAMESGFTWAVDDPGGRLSQAKIQQARGGGPEVLEAQRWCLDYNESDVAAQAAIRDGIREMFPVGSTAY